VDEPVTATAAREDDWLGYPLAAGCPALHRLVALMAHRERLAVLPTPLHHAPRLSQHLGREVWLKRDDLTGTGMGGNKIRKLELLASDARRHCADTLVSVGAPQSNHARTVAVAAAVLGLDCHLVLGGDPPDRPTGNLILDRLTGARLVWAGTHDWGGLADALDALVAELQEAGARPYPMPVGGSVPLGAAAFVAGYLELLVQCEQAGLVPDAVVHASSSAGTQAGLHLGSVIAPALLDRPAPRVVGVDVAKITDPLADEVARLAAGTAALLELDGVVPLDRHRPVVLDGYLGPGYARSSPESMAALRLLTRLEGVPTDPVYSAKAFQALVAEPGLGDPVVFWHTGGLPALFSDELPLDLLDPDDDQP
jgi:1-aminocyclopropane-1-carboxylate deaminase/D-cysteine desulfhydrase-like pyridoxal-dependent ACC family enzyme